MDQLLAVYRTEGILYVNDILLINITNSLFAIYIYSFLFGLMREECSNYGFVITVIIAHAQYTLVLIFVIYDNTTSLCCLCCGSLSLTCI